MTPKGHLTILKTILFFLVFISSNTYTAQQQQLNNSSSTTGVNIDSSGMLERCPQHVDENDIEHSATNTPKTDRENQEAEQNTDSTQQPLPYKRYAKNIAWATVAYGLHATNKRFNYARTTFIPELIKEQIEENNLNKVFLRKELILNTGLPLSNSKDLYQSFKS